MTIDRKLQGLTNLYSNNYEETTLHYSSYQLTLGNQCGKGMKLHAILKNIKEDTFPCTCIIVFHAGGSGVDKIGLLLKTTSEQTYLRICFASSSFPCRTQIVKPFQELDIPGIGRKRILLAFAIAQHCLYQVNGTRTDLR